MFRVRFAACAAFVAALVGCEVKFNAGNNPNPGVPNEQAGPKRDPAEVALQRLNGKVKRDAGRPDNPVVEVTLYGETTDADLKELTQFPALRKLQVRGHGVTGAGLGVLAPLPLEDLDLSWTKTDDAGLREVGKLTSLKVLNIRSCPVTDAGVKELAGLTELEDLAVGEGPPGVNDVGFYALKGCKKLRKVKATNCGVGDGAMKTLSALPEMRVLILYGSAVTDVGYGYIARMEKLEELWVSTSITAKGLAEVGRLPNLRNLNLSNAWVGIAPVRAMGTLKQLKDLDISTWYIKPEEADALRGELLDCNVRYRK